MKKSLSLLKGFIASALVVGLFAGCAKERPVEKVKFDDKEVERIPKTAFVGKDAKTRTEWFHKITVTKVSRNGGFVFNGLQSDTSLGYFDFTKDKLQFVNLVSPFEGEPSSAKRREVINQWPIKHFDVELAESDGKTLNREEPADDIDLMKRRYVNVNLAQSDFSEGATFPYVDLYQEFKSCWTKTDSRLVENSLEILPDYIGFVVETQYELNLKGAAADDFDCVGLSRMKNLDMTFTAQYRYSFRKSVETGYKSLAFSDENDPMLKKFGYFQTVRQFLNPKTGLVDKRIFANRWDPNKTHDFYFTKDFPEEYKHIFSDPKVGIFPRTNALLKKQGIPMRFRIRENRDGDGKVKEFGDGRYSFINIVSEIDEEAPLGYGPSDANPLTGEIISASTTIWTGFLKYYLEVVKGRFENEEVKYSQSTLYREMLNALGQPPENWSKPLDSKSKEGSFFLRALPEITFSYPGWSRFSALDKNNGFDLSAELPSSGKSKSINQLNLSRLMTPGQDGADGKLTNQMEQEFSLTAFLDRSLMVQVPGKKLPEGTSSEKLKEVIETLGKLSEQSEREIELQKKGHCVFGFEEALGTLDPKDLRDISAKKAAENILFEVAFHEVGHNLNLRHNFYGSLDKPNFPGLDVATTEKSKDSAGTAHVAASTVMDYLDLPDYVTKRTNDWGPYDKAALSYAYSDGKVFDESKNYLFCTDEHTILNALCNRHDKGTSPSEIANYMIERYEDMYFARNRRWIRPYWDSRKYLSQVYSVMRGMKKFLAFYESSLVKDEMTRLFSKIAPETNVDEAREIELRIKSDVRQAIRLSLAFYHSVIQQSESDRPWRTQFGTFNGELERIGIFWDKLLAMYFLGSDQGLLYNTNRPLFYTSYLTHIGNPELGPLVQDILRSTVTVRVAMELWFISFGRLLYAVNASNYVNRQNPLLIDKIRVARYDANELRDNFGVDPSTMSAIGGIADEEPEEPNIVNRSNNDVTYALIRLPKAEDGFRFREPVAIAKIGKYFYMVSKDKSSYAYDIIKELEVDLRERRSTNESRMDLLELYNLYNFAVGESP